MDRNDDARGTEDTTANREHVQNAEENRDALAAQAERTRATTPAETDTPIGGANRSGSGGTSGSGTAGMDNTDAVRAAAENRDALAEENRRVAATTPDDVPMTGPDTRRDDR